MHQEPKFYVRREECWGGTYVWMVVDRESRKVVSRTALKTEKAAIALRDRMEADWARYCEARA